MTIKHVSCIVLCICLLLLFLWIIYRHSISNMGIYKLVSRDGVLYVGKSKNLAKRKYQHFHKLKNGTHFNKCLQSYYDRNNEVYFKTVLNCGEKELDKKERETIKRLAPFFNKNLNKKNECSSLLQQKRKR